MTLPYQEFRFITPPRAEAKQSPLFLERYEGRGFVGSVKKNGTNSVIFVPPDRAPFAYERHGAPHKAWGDPNGKGQRGVFPQGQGDLFRKLPGKAYFVYNAELIHSKTPHLKNIHYIYDILVCEGIQLTGTTYEYRYQLILDTLGDELEPLETYKGDHYPVDNSTWIARNYTSDFSRLFKSLIAPEDEGLVLRLPVGRWYEGKADNWMVKFRRAGAAGEAKR
jgi:hypothetical protein